MTFEDLPIEKKHEINRCTRQVLKDLGANAALKGYTYTIAAVLILVADSNTKFKMTGENGIYNIVADHMNLHWTSVEHTIRNFVQSVILNGDRETIFKVFGNYQQSAAGAIVASNFLYGLKAEVLERLGVW